MTRPSPRPRAREYPIPPAARLRTVLVLAAGLLLAGCHCKFKKHAPTLGAVGIQVVNTGGPEVHLGRMAPSDDQVGALISATVNTVQAVREVGQVERIAQAVDITAVNNAFERGLADALGSGPPFAYTDRSPAPALLQLEVMSYGLTVPYLGAPGEFTYEIRARIYRRDGERVYRHRMTCSIGAGDPDATARVLGVVNNVREIDRMTDADIQEAFMVTARWCGSRWVTRLRKHAG